MIKSKMLFLSLLVLAGCSFGGPEENKTLEKTISSEIQHKKTDSIKLSSETSFQWDKAYLFDPYTTQEGMNKQLGFKFKDPGSLHSRDDIQLLLFVKNDKVVQYAQISRKNGELINQKEDGYTPKDDVIKIRKEAVH